MNCIACNLMINTNDFWETKSIVSDEILKVHFCPNCGLGKTELTSSENLEAANSIQYDNIENRIDIYFHNLRNHITLRYNNSLKVIKSFSQGLDLLEVGSNIGYTLNLAKKFGYNSYGCEINKNCREFSKLVYNQTVFEDFFDIQKTFDVIIMNDVLEHFENPKDAIVHAEKILNENGVLFIQLPNISSKKAQKQKGNWKYLLAPDHTYHFNLKSLTELLKQSDIELVWNQEVSAIEDVWPFSMFGAKILKLINNNPYYHPKLFKKENGDLLQSIYQKK